MNAIEILTGPAMQMLYDSDSFVVVHMQADDLKTDPTGNAGARAACGVIR